MKWKTNKRSYSFKVHQQRLRLTDKKGQKRRRNETKKGNNLLWISMRPLIFRASFLFPPEPTTDCLPLRLVIIKKIMDTFTTRTYFCPMSKQPPLPGTVFIGNWWCCCCRCLCCANGINKIVICQMLVKDDFAEKKKKKKRNNRPQIRKKKIPSTGSNNRLAGLLKRIQ